MVWFLFYSASTHFRPFRAQSVTLSILFLGEPPRQLTSTVHTLTPVTDNCSSCISRTGRMAVDIFSWLIYTKECAGRGDRTRGRLHAKRTRFRTSYRALVFRWLHVSYILNQKRNFTFRVLRYYAAACYSTQYNDLFPISVNILLSNKPAKFNLSIVDLTTLWFQYSRTTNQKSQF